MSSNRYVVWSLVLVGDVPTEVREVARTVEKVAQEDAALLAWVGHRKTWVQDTEESRK